MAAPVPYRARRPRSQEGRETQLQVQRVAEAVTKTRVDQEAAQRVTQGMVVLWPDTITPPAGWLRCDGSAVRRQAYAGLFNVVGDAAPFGPGDGSTTFELPDLTAWAPADFAAWIWAG